MSSTNMTEFSYFVMQFNRIVPPIIFIFGTIGNLLSIIAFSSRTLRKNPCATYLFGLAIAHLNNLIFGLLLNYLIDAHGIDLLTISIVFCRIRFLILHCSVVLSSWFIILAGFDRYFISSMNVHRRNLSTLKNARRTVAVAVLLCFILYAHILGLFTIEQTPTNKICYAQSGTYRIFYDFLFFTTFSFTPPFIMIGVGVATLYNTLHVRRQIDVVENNRSVKSTTSANHINHFHRKHRQFIKMLLIQLTFTVVLTLPIAVQKLYATFTNSITKDSYRISVENFFAQFVRTLTHVNSAIGFYL